MPRRQTTRLLFLTPPWSNLKRSGNATISVMPGYRILKRR
jgi:hypothetical protein